MLPPLDNESIAQAAWHFAPCGLPIGKELGEASPVRPMMDFKSLNQLRGHCARCVHREIVQFITQSSVGPGLEDAVDSHWRELFKAAALSTLLGAATEIGSSGTDNDIIRALRRGAGDTLNQTGQQVVRRNLNIQPTLTIRPGFPVRIIVNRDLILEPYRG